MSSVSQQPGLDAAGETAGVGTAARGTSSACEPCSTAKAKCLRSNPAVGTRCDRCQRLDKDCTEKQPKIRKKRRTKPSKTEQIEERLAGLVQLLQASGSISSGFNTSTSPKPPQNLVPEPDSQRTSLNRGLIWVPDTYNQRGPQHCICRPTPGQVQGPIESDDTLLRIYQEELAPAYPFVIVPKDVSASHIQSTRPFLMACIRMVASFHSMKSRQGQMYQLMSHIAERMLIQSERSLDLLSGIIVILGWHHYHCLLHAQLHNLMSLAVTLTAELGLKRRPRWQERTRLMVLNLGEESERTNEERRLLLAVWYMSSCVSAGLLQLDSMSFSPYMNQCFLELEKAREYDSDLYLVQLIRVQQLSDKITALCMGDEVDEQSYTVPRAPKSGYVHAFQTDLDRLAENIPGDPKQKQILRTHLNTAKLRLYEPPHVDAAFIASVSKSLINTHHMNGSRSPLDELYASNAALKRWFDEWLSFPVSSYYSVPLPVSLDIIYAATMLGRWAKLAMPGSVRPVSSPVPHDPSGFYNKSTSAGNTPANSSAASSDAPSPQRLERQLGRGMAMLRMQLARQPGLYLDVTNILSTLCAKMEQASAGLVERGVDPQAWERNTWALGAIKLRIAQLKLEQWTDDVSEHEPDEAQSQQTGEAVGHQPDDGTVTGQLQDVEMTGPRGLSSVMEGWTGTLSPTSELLQTGDWFQDLDGLLWNEPWGGWDLPFVVQHGPIQGDSSKQT